MTTPTDPRALIQEGRKHDEAMTDGPWLEPEGGRLRGAVDAIVDGHRRQVAQASAEAPSAEEALNTEAFDLAGPRLLANAAGIAWFGTHRRALLDGYERSLDEVARLRRELTKLRADIDGDRDCRSWTTEIDAILEGTCTDATKTK